MYSGHFVVMLGGLRSVPLQCAAVQAQSLKFKVKVKMMYNLSCDSAGCSILFISQDMLQRHVRKIWITLMSENNKGQKTKGMVKAHQLVEIVGEGASCCYLCSEVPSAAKLQYVCSQRNLQYLSHQCEFTSSLHVLLCLYRFTPDL